MECFLSAFWRFSGHSKSTLWGTPSQVPVGHFRARAPGHSCKWRPASQVYTFLPTKRRAYFCKNIVIKWEVYCDTFQNQRKRDVHKMSTRNSGAGNREVSRSGVDVTLLDRTFVNLFVEFWAFSMQQTRERMVHMDIYDKLQGMQKNVWGRRKE